MRQTSASTTSPRRTTNGSKAALPAAVTPQFTSSTKVDLCAAVRDACAEVAASLAYHGHLESPRAAKALTVPADMAGLVLVIVREAVANAIRYAHPTGVEGKLFVACARESSGAIGIAVTDDGVGLPENFDPATDGGTGLRLMRTSSERLGGRLSFKSTCLGLVVRLRVEMPALARAANGRAADANGAPLPEAALPAEHGSQLLEALPAAVYTTDAKGLITFYNAAAATLWGCRPELGKSEFCGSWKLYWPDGTPLPHDECPMAMALKQKQAIRGLEAVAERPDGTRVPFIPYPTPVFDASGALAGAVNMLVDITERKRAEEALAKRSDEQSALYQFTDRLFRAGATSDLYDAALDAIQRALGCERASILLFDASDTMKFVAWRGLSEGYRRAVEGHSPWTRDVKDPQPICLSDLETADLPQSLAATVRAEGIGALAFIPLLADGRLIGKFMTYYGAPHAFGDAEVDLAVTIARQLGFSLERMRADEARRRAEKDLSDFFENASVGLHSVGPDGIILRANRRELEMLGYRAEEYIGRHVSDFHVDKSVAADILQRLSTGEVLHNYFSQLRCKDGSVRDVSIASSVLWEGDRFLHTRCFTRDITDLRRADHAAHLLASIVETSDDAIVSKDLDGIVTSWNRGAEKVFGYTAEEMIGRSITTLIPDGRHNEEPEILGRIRRGDSVEHYETVRRRKDGTLIDVALTVSPVKDASGKIVGASKIARDVTEQKQAQERQELLTREIDHRTKNLFAVVHAVVARSFMGKRTVKDAEEAVLSRLRSLAQTHVMLIDKEWHGADLAEVLRSELSPHSDRVRMAGPKLLLSAKAAQNFALAVHELATNAAKYGALSNAAGRVDIGWSVINSNGSGSFKFRWQERGGPPVSPPTQKGFGTVVLEQVMAEYFETPPQVDFAPTGVSYEINGSLDAIAADGPPAPPPKAAAAPSPRAKRASPSNV
jgi:PAS domain S-box-containing protein